MSSWSQKTGYARDDEWAFPPGTRDFARAQWAVIRWPRCDCTLLPTSYYLMLIAYIDTALGSMLLQAMAGMIFAAMVMGRRILAIPLAWMSSKNSAQDTDAEDLEE
jgi:hypothetical protein